MVTIRSFTREDAEALQYGLYPDMTRSEISDMIEEWNASVCRGRYFEMFAILFDERIVGCVSLYERSGFIASAGVEVMKEARGRGAASEALSWLTRYAAEKGYRILQDQVRKDNPASIRLHEKLGFQSDGSVYHNQRDHEVLLYLKPL